jgi:osmotically-inducible protein OsmY
MTLTNQPTDLRLLDVVVRQLEWDPAVDASSLQVTAHDGVVSLGGWIDSYPGRLAAEKAAKRVPGVREVTNLVEVRPRVDRTDEDMVQDAAAALRLHSTVPHAVCVEVGDGVVTLSGRVDWPFQRRAADRAVREIRGIRGVLNLITVAPRAAVRDLEHRLVRTLRHNADVDAHRIKVKVVGDRAMLSGTAASWLQREAAERAVADAPGIARVENLIEIELPREGREVDELC